MSAQTKTTPFLVLTAALLVAAGWDSPGANVQRNYST